MPHKLIETDLEYQVMGCTVCKEVVEIPRRVMRDPEQMINMAEYLRDDHRECAANPDNLRMAVLTRTMRKGVERELAKNASADVERARGRA